MHNCGSGWPAISQYDSWWTLVIVRSRQSLHQILLGQLSGEDEDVSLTVSSGSHLHLMFHVKGE